MRHGFGIAHIKELLIYVKKHCHQHQYLGILCNKTNPIFELYTFFQSFWIPYHLPLCYHVTVRLMSGSLNSHHAPVHMTKSLLMQLSASSCDSQFHSQLPFTLLVTHSCLLHYYSALPLTFILTPWCSLAFSLVCHLYLLPLSLYYDSFPYQAFPLHTILSYQTTFATILTTFNTLLRPL